MVKVNYSWPILLYLSSKLIYVLEKTFIEKFVGS